MSNRDQCSWLPSECILSKDRVPNPAAPSPVEVSKPPSRRFESKARATSHKSKDRDRVKPPANGFLLFRSEYVNNPANKVSTDGHKKRQVDLTREAGAAWRHLFQEQRDVYRATARQNMEAHKTRHPDYWTSRRGKDGKFARADPKREQGSSVKVSHGEHEAVLSVDPRSQSAFAPTAADSPSSSIEDAPSPCPSLSSSVSDDDCPTPRPSSESECPQSFPSVASAGPSLEHPSLGGLEPYSFPDFIDESQILSTDAPTVLSWWLSETSPRTDPCADMAAPQEGQEASCGLLYEDWAFTRDEDFFFVDDPQALEDPAVPLVGVLTSQDATLDA